MPSRLRSRLRSIVSPFRSSSICSKRPSTVRFWTAPSLTMWVRNSSSPVSLRNTKNVQELPDDQDRPRQTGFTRWRGAGSSEARRYDPGRGRCFGSLSVHGKIELVTWLILKFAFLNVWKRSGLTVCLQWSCQQRFIRFRKERLSRDSVSSKLKNKFHTVACKFTSGSFSGMGKRGPVGPDVAQ